MKTTARIELPIGVEIESGMTLEAEEDRKHGIANVTIDSVNRLGDNRILIGLEMDIDLIATFRGSNRFETGPGATLPPDPRITVGIKLPKEKE